MIPLVGSRVRRVDRPTRELVTLELSAGERAVLLLSAVGSAAGVGVVRARPRGRPVDAFGMLLRRKIEGGTIAALEGSPRGARLVFAAQDGGLVALELLHTREGRGFRLLDAAGHRLGETTRDLAEVGDTHPIDEEPLLERGESLLRSLDERMRRERREACVETLDRAVARLDRAIAAVTSDAARVDDAGRLRHEADLLISANLDEHAGRTQVEVFDWALDPPAARTIELDPRHKPREEAERRYRRARKLERGREIALERRAKLERDREPLLALLATARNAEDDDALTAIEDALQQRGFAPSEPARKHAAPPPRTPYREFRSLRGVPIWVGRGAADNDELTVRLARPHHLFLHARGVPGAHVIVVLPKGAVCDETTLADAATLAAHFSDARGESPVEVLHAERRHVRKRKGSPAGAVQVDREKVMLLRFEPARLSRLLDSEVSAPSKRKRPRGS